MSSSPVTTVSVEPGVLARPGLLELVEQVTDPRARRGVRHRFASLLAAALAAVLGGARSFTAIGEWVADAESGVLARLGISGARRPCEATIRRVLTRTDRWRAARRRRGGADAHPGRPAGWAAGDRCRRQD